MRIYMRVAHDTEGLSPSAVQLVKEASAQATMLAFQLFLDLLKIPNNGSQATFPSSLTW